MAGRHERHNLATPARHRGGDFAGDTIRRRLHRIVAQVSMPLHCLGVAIPQHDAHHDQAVAGRGADRSERVPQIVQPHVVEHGAVTGCGPRLSARRPSHGKSNDTSIQARDAGRSATSLMELANGALVLEHC